MDIKKLSEPLSVDQIEFRVQSINKGGYATILAYKDARVDQQRLDEVVGPLNWKREHTRDNHNCVISIWCDDKKQWVSKEDTGTESSAEKEKGLASDSFKRAAFNWGIGRELYDYPVIQIKLNPNEFTVDGNGRAKQSWDLKLKEWKWFTQFHEGKVLRVGARDNHGKVRFDWVDPDLSYKKVSQENESSILAIKESIQSGDISSAAEAYYELDQKTQQELHKAPTKGGCFTIEEMNVIKSPEFRKAHFGE